ncbi:transposase [Cumulibacter manganitolerans]|uniref:transposase n=1 Tax=Cumulibacter manganitolerans TaxID=1884992 RepID=UPI0038994BD3
MCSAADSLVRTSPRSASEQASCPAPVPGCGRIWRRPSRRCNPNGSSSRTSAACSPHLPVAQPRKETNLLRAGAEKLTAKQWTRLENAIAARPDEHLPVYLAWSCAQQLRSAYRHPNPAEGRKIAEKVLDSFPTCPIPEIARLGRTLKRWRHAFLAYFDTGRSNNGGTEAINGLIELHRRVARGFRNYDNYRLRMLLIGGGLTSPHLK